tara:strand:+ start:81 stop:509 length:429 start_codon:yes stop_codon:yes gene_type:complete
MKDKTEKMKPSMIAHLIRDGAKRKIAIDIEKAKRSQMRFSIAFRYVGLVLVQGSSALALANFPMVTYWIALWLGLLVYQITAFVFYIEDNRIYELTRIKYAKGYGSSQSTVDSLKVKRNREIVYLIGNTCGLILIGSNILWG